MQTNKQMQWTHSLRLRVAVLGVVALVGGWNAPVSAAQEHPTTLPGELPGSSVKPAVSLDAVAQSIQSYVKKKSQSGAFVLHDAKTGKDLQLTLDKVHRDRLASIGSDQYFACTDFKGADGHTYDVDFFVHGTTQQDLKVIEKDTSVHKVDGKPRYNWHYNKDSGLWEKQPVAPAKGNSGDK